jgi:hypothetical protein
MNREVCGLCGAPLAFPNSCACLLPKELRALAARLTQQYWRGSRGAHDFDDAMCQAMTLAYAAGCAIVAPNGEKSTEAGLDAGIAGQME